MTNNTVEREATEHDENTWEHIKLYYCVSKLNVCRKMFPVSAEQVNLTAAYV